MPTTTTTAPALDRRALLSRALAGAAGAAIGATAAMQAKASSPDDAELLTMIAEERRLLTVGEDYDRQLQELFSKQPEDVRMDWYRDMDNLPEPAASLYRESARWLDPAYKLGIRIEATTPRTIAGAIALIEWKDEDSPVLANVIAGLRTLAAGGAA